MFGILVLCAAIIGPNDDENPVSFVYFVAISWNLAQQALSQSSMVDQNNIQFKPVSNPYCSIKSVFRGWKIQSSFKQLVTLISTYKRHMGYQLNFV